MGFFAGECVWSVPFVGIVAGVCVVSVPFVAGVCVVSVPFVGIVAFVCVVSVLFLVPGVSLFGSVGGRTVAGLPSTMSSIILSKAWKKSGTPS